MKTFEKFKIDDEREKERIFLYFAHIDELEIKFDFIEYKQFIYYFYKEYTLLCQDKVKQKFNISIRIWSVFESKTGLNHKETKNFIKQMLNKYFNFDKYTIHKGLPQGIILIEKHFKIK
ncbi:hypothetical protein M0Q50_08525 [bacterium]|jgi:hypothetical protein|nr:hypothetical protein [bacterium]